MSKPHMVRGTMHNYIVCVPENWEEEDVQTWLQTKDGYKIKGTEEVRSLTDKIPCEKCHKTGFKHVTVNMQ